MTPLLRFGGVPVEHANEIMNDAFKMSHKERVFKNVQRILNIDENAEKYLNCYVRSTLIEVKKMMKKKIRKKFAEKSNLKNTFLKMKNKLFMIKKHTINQFIKIETYAEMTKTIVTTIKKSINSNENSKIATIALTETRKAKKVLIHMINAENKQKVREIMDKDLLKRIQRIEGKTVKKAAAVRWFFSGDVLISMIIKKTKKRMKKNEK